MPRRIELPDGAPATGDVQGKHVVITGAGRGLGHVLAWSFSHAGAKVALVARTRNDLEDVAAALPAQSLVLPGDVRDAGFNESVADRVVQEWGSLDVWIANAGIAPVLAPPTQLDEAVWRDVLDVNLTGVFLGAKAAARVMGRGGRIIATGSVAAERPERDIPAYAAAKAGVVALIKSLALDLGPRGITANVVAPGWFDSPLVEHVKRNPGRTQAIYDHTALGRFGATDELAGAYLFLASEAAAYVTGTVLTVDGGFLLG